MTSDRAGSRRAFLGQTAAVGAAAWLCRDTSPRHDERVSAAQFESLVGQQVLIRGEQGTHRLPLKSVHQHSGHDRPAHVRQDPFSLVFTGDRRLEFEDQICEICHPTLGPVKVFISACGPRDREVALQAVFA